jgi:hypothetical protein
MSGHELCQPPGLRTADGVHAALDWLRDRELRPVIAHMAAAQPLDPETGAQMLEAALRWTSRTRAADREAGS